MPIDKYGRVVVNPNLPLGLSDFQQLYTANGMSPDQNASRLWMDSPTEAKSYMSDQWSKLNTGSSPEQYFNNPDNIAAQLAGRQAPVSRGRQQPMAIPPSVPAWGVSDKYSDPDVLARQQYDASWNPLVRPTYATQDATSAFPGNVDQPTNLEDIRRSQLAGDVTGVATKFLARQGSRAYVPSSGFGELDETNPTKDDLDRTVINDPDFVQLQARNPDQAAFVYKRLTGREYQNDAKAAISYRDDRLKYAQRLQDDNFATDAKRQNDIKNIGLTYTKQQLEQGAQINPSTGKWEVWNMQDPPAQDGGLSLGGSSATRPYRQKTEATELQNKWLNENSPLITGQPIDRQQLQVNSHANQAADFAASDPAVAAAILDWKQKSGTEPTAQEKMLLASHIKNQQVGIAEDQIGNNWVGQAARMSYNTIVRAPLGYKPVTSDDPTMGDFSAAPQNITWWGKVLQSMGAGGGFTR